ncbi:NB-ARC domain containing protein [Trema orientale]|uniref:NB-ARC domain containing protein n=1 Tax=Trema orientale TaxID=63057 RepID=A0A2P5F7H2_TREOI|nr:NB-ARC domain containing protein [Trema orientale]
MAQIVLSSVIQVVIDYLASPIIEKFSNMWDLRGNIRKLQQNLPKVRALLKDAEQQEVTNTAVRIWLSKLKAIANDAEILLVDFTINDKLIYLRHAEKVKDMLQMLEEITNEGLRLNLKEASMAHYGDLGTRETSSFVVESEVYGREEDKEEIIKLLLSCETARGEVSCISVIGIGGIGKTTFAQLVYNDQQVTQHFDVKVWVFVSNLLDAKNIMISVIESLSKAKRQYLNMDVLHSEVWRLLYKKRYLIVLDDVWSENQEEWEKLKPLFRGGVDGSKILMTTRSGKVALLMNCPTISYYLKGLPEDACWSLFIKRAFRRGEEGKNQTLLPIGKEIVKKCGGIALAAKSLGSLMSFKREESEWWFVRDSELWNLDESQNGILPALRLSYFNLPPALRNCFAFCSIFPRSYEIEKEKLIHLWMVEGLIEYNDNEGSKPGEDIGNDYVNDLLWMSFFQEIKQSGIHHVVTRSYKMHD